MVLGRRHKLGRVFEDICHRLVPVEVSEQLVLFELLYLDPTGLVQSEYFAKKIFQKELIVHF